MKNFQILSGDDAKIVDGSLTLAELKTLYNALLLDVLSDQATGQTTPTKIATFAKVEALVLGGNNQKLKWHVQE